MRLTWRDGVATILVACIGAVTFAVTERWDWPLLGSNRAGIGVLATIGWGMCMVGGSRTTSSFKGPAGVLASVLGVVALVLIVLGLITGSETVLLALATDIGVLWLVATTRHATARRATAPAPRAL
jgi:hypothetical protein